MKTDFDKIIDRKNTACFKWDLNKEGFKRKDIISMWVADMDLPVAPEITKSIIDRASHPVYGYTFRNDDFYRPYIAWQAKRNQWQIERDWIINSCSVVISINMILQAMTPKKGRILIMTPVYGQFSATVNLAKRVLINSPMRNMDGFYTPDFTDIEQHFKDGIDAFILCSPHNPVGRVWTKSELLRMAELCLQYNVLLIADEIHSDLVYEESHHIPIASLSKEISAITITCTAPGKTFNISGLSIGFIIIENKEIRNKIYEIFSSQHLLAANIFGIEACRTAYEKGDRWLSEALSYLQSNRDFLVDYINNEIPLLEVYQPEGTYLAWIDFRNLKLSQSDLICFLVFVAGLGLDNGGKFGDDGLGFMRLNFACSRILLKKALDHLAASVRKLIDVDLDIRKLIDESEVIEDCD